MVTALAALAEDRDSFGLQHPHGGSHALVTPALEDICHPFLASVGTADTWCTDKKAGKISVHLMKKKSEK